MLFSPFLSLFSRIALVFTCGSFNIYEHFSLDSGIKIQWSAFGSHLWLGGGFAFYRNPRKGMMKWGRWNGKWFAKVIDQEQSLLTEFIIEIEREPRLNGFMLM